MELVDRLGAAETWIEKLEEQRVKIQKVLQEIDPGLAESHTERVKEFEYRWIQRMRSHPELIEQGMPQPLTFEEGTTSVDLVDWFPAQESDAAKLELIDKDDRSTYCIECERFEDIVASWRCRRYCGEASIDSKGDISMKGSFQYPMIAGQGLKFEFIEDPRRVVGREYLASGSRGPWSLKCWKINARSSLCSSYVHVMAAFGSTEARSSSIDLTKIHANGLSHPVTEAARLSRLSVLS